MRWKRSRARCAFAAASVITAVVVSACGPGSGGTPSTSGPIRLDLRQSAEFISLRLAPKSLRDNKPEGFEEVAVSNVRTGGIVRRLLPADRDGMSVDGLSLDRSGDLWITYSKGPFYRNDTESGDPKPDSCANEIAILHARTGRLSVFLRTGNNVLISGAAVSPDGALLAYDEGGCTNGSSYLRITDMRTRHSWTIGRSLGRCDEITDPSWTVDGRALLVGYAAPLTRAVTGPGLCPGVAPERLVELNPAAQSGMNGRSFSAGRGCEIRSVAGTAGGGMLAAEACGGSDYISGAARLVVIDARFRLVGRLALGRCTDGNALSTNHSGRGALISAYLYCDPPGTPGPVTRLWSYAGGKLHLLTSIPGGTLTVSLMTW
jgi:hypothetical protein